MTEYLQVMPNNKPQSLKAPYRFLHVQEVRQPNQNLTESFFYDTYHNLEHQNLKAVLHMAKYSRT
jgi:hypothetical protein